MYQYQTLIARNVQDELATVEWRFTDAGEPGRNDTAAIVVRDRTGAVVLSVTGLLSGGNHQAHER